MLKQSSMMIRSLKLQLNNSELKIREIKMYLRKKTEKKQNLTKMRILEFNLNINVCLEDGMYHVCWPKIRKIMKQTVFLHAFIKHLCLSI